MNAYRTLFQAPGSLSFTLAGLQAGFIIASTAGGIVLLIALGGYLKPARAHSSPA